MPQNVCKTCMTWCFNFQNFLTQIRNSQEALKQALFLETIKKSQTDDENVTIVFKDDEELDIHYSNMLTNFVSDTESNHPELEEEEIKIKTVEEPVNLGEQDDKVELKTNEKYPYTCHACGRGFDKHAEWLRHKKKTNHRGVSFYCIYCGKSNFRRNVISFKAHLCRHTQEKPNICNKCGKAFSDPSCLSRHIKTVHSSPSAKVYTCKLCSKEIHRSDNLLAHERNCDGIQRAKGRKRKGKLQCSECGILVSKLLFHAHVKEHEQGSVTCDICGKEFSSASRIKSHKKWAHSEATFTCDVCGITVRRKTTLQKHINEVHLGKVTTYPCEYCEKVFHSKSWYRAHLRIHTNDTKYQCKTCLKICVTRRKLEQHTRVHTGERRYECAECGKKFASQENLKMHIKMHNGPPTHKCSLCPKGFFMNCLLQKHIRQVHNKKDKKVADLTHEESESEDEDRFSILKNIFRTI